MSGAMERPYRGVVQYQGYRIERGDFVNTPDDRTDRWYVVDPEATAVDHRGAGFRTVDEARQFIREAHHREAERYGYHILEMD